MKRPTPASLKKVTPENLANLGAERLAEILVGWAAARPDLKRRLRMELAAEQGAEHLSAEIDKRLATIEASRGKISWRTRATFLRDLEGLRLLISERLGALDRRAALDRLLVLLALARRTHQRTRDPEGQVDALFARVAADVGILAGQEAAETVAPALAASIRGNAADWAVWAPQVMAGSPPALAEAILHALAEGAGAPPGFGTIIRALADAAGLADPWIATFTPKARQEPEVAAQIARRLMAAGRTDEAGAALTAAQQPARALAKAAEGPDPEWEGAWIDWLEASGGETAAQAARWAAFERTLSAPIAREYVRRLPDFEDVEAETKAFALAATHEDAAKGLAFLMDWPALPEAARMIAARADEIDAAPNLAETWAERLAARHSPAAALLLRKSAARAFRRREFKVCDRLTDLADQLG